MEKYLSLTVGRLKFIDSFQFTPQSLDSLVKTLEEDEFKYVRESFPAHQFDLIPITIWIASPGLMNLDCLRMMHSLTNCLTVRVRTQSTHTQFECGLPLDVSQCQTITTSTGSAMCCSWQMFSRSFVQPVRSTMISMLHITTPLPVSFGMQL